MVSGEPKVTGFQVRVEDVVKFELLGVIVCSTCAFRCLTEISGARKTGITRDFRAINHVMTRLIPCTVSYYLSVVTEAVQWFLRMTNNSKSIDLCVGE